MAEGIRSLGLALGELLSDPHTKGNLVYSPASLAIALSMLRDGAGPAAAAAIDNALAMPTNRHQAYAALSTALAGPGPGNVLTVSNGLFLDPRLQVQPSYLVSLKKWYDAGVYQARFPQPALDDVNAYVDKATHGRVPKMFDSFPDLARFALVDAVYLDAKWRSPFEVAETTTSPFTTGTGTAVKVKTMHEMSVLDYASGAGWQAVRLPYRGGRLSMWVLLPEGSTAPLDLLAPAALARADSAFDERHVELSLPRWDFGDTLKLKTVLSRLGLASIFRLAAFPGITPDPKFQLAKALQRANITVGEKGTVAAAVTGFVGIAGSGQMPPGDLVRMDVDHPFAFAVVDTTTGVPLFEGTVSDPTQHTTS